MRTRSTRVWMAVAAALAVVVTAGAPTAGAAPGPPAPHHSPRQVSLLVSDASPLVGDEVSFHGRVRTGTRGTPVRLQRRSPGGSGWQTVATTRRGGAGHYELVQPMRVNGEFSYRVVAGQGAVRYASRHVQVRVYRWLRLDELPNPREVQLMSVGVDVPIDGTSYPSSITQWPNSHPPGSGVMAFYRVSLHGGCSTLTGRVGLDDRSLPGSTSDIQVYTQGRTFYMGTVAAGSATDLDADISGVDQLIVFVFSQDGGLGALGSPRVLCSS